MQQIIGGAKAPAGPPSSATVVGHGGEAAEGGVVLVFWDFKYVGSEEILQRHRAATVVNCRPMIFDAKGTHLATPEMCLLKLSRGGPYSMVQRWRPSPSTSQVTLSMMIKMVCHRLFPSMFIDGEIEGLDHVFRNLLVVLYVYFED
jgi:hypothetical protein